LNLLLALMKALLAFFSGSLTITASAVDSATDAVASLAIFIGILLSGRKSVSFPLGLYKLENIAAVVIAIFIFIAGYEIVQQVLRPASAPPDISPLTIGLLAGGTVAAFLFGRYATAVGNQTGSPTLIAEGRHRQVDVLASIVVVGSIILSYFHVHIDFWGLSIDRIGAGLILVFILKAGWDLLSDGMRVLLDASIDAETLYRIRSIIQSEPLVDGVQSLMGRSAGRFQFIQGSITLKTRDLVRAHAIGTQIESEIRRQVPHIERIMIRYAPQKKTHELLALPLDAAGGRISGHFGEAPYYGFVRIRTDDRSIGRLGVIANPHCTVETAKGIRVAEWLISRGVGHVAVKEKIAHRGPGYVLSNGGVRIHNTHAESIAQAIDDIAAAI
jgi:cation diffusion facilitator family transporter